MKVSPVGLYIPKYTSRFMYYLWIIDAENVIKEAEKEMAFRIKPLLFRCLIISAHCACFVSFFIFAIRSYMSWRSLLTYRRIRYIIKKAKAICESYQCRMRRKLAKSEIRRFFLLKKHKSTCSFIPFIDIYGKFSFLCDDIKFHSECTIRKRNSMEIFHRQEETV